MITNTLERGDLDVLSDAIYAFSLLGLLMYSCVFSLFITNGTVFEQSKMATGSRIRQRRGC